MQSKIWQIKAEAKDKKDIVNILLANRGLKTKTEIDNFLSPEKPSTISLSEYGLDSKEVIKAIKRVLVAIENKEKIVIYGDYDADGISATAVLWEFLNSNGANVMPYIPSRAGEGYGLSIKGIDNCIAELNPKLIITVDHGIVAVDQIEYAKSKDLDVIVTDHHVAGKIIPKALAVIHTISLSGSGIAWVFANSLNEKMGETKKEASSLLELAAIGSIADLVPLTGVNRSVVKFGLSELNKTKRPGLIALFDEARIFPGSLGTYEVGYILAPRLNAMGRLEHALDSLRLLCTKNKDQAAVLAEKLSFTNKERQKLTETTTLHAKELFGNGKKTEKLIFLSHETYNPGIIGLVAGKLVEEYYLPSIVVARGETISKASARSIEGFNIVEVIRSCTDILIDVGGHPMAAGFTVENSKLELLEKRLKTIAGEQLTKSSLVKKINIDCEIDLINIDMSLYSEIKKLEPFGIGNPEPLFAVKNCRLLEFRPVGSEGKHLRLYLAKDGDDNKSFFEAIAFNFGNIALELKPHSLVDIAFAVTLDEWNGQKKIKLRLKDLKIKL